MNLADYLSELLGQYEEVSVPGLGYFVREHVNGYYSDRDAKFYPPTHRIKFVQELRDDDVFAQYVADKKNISLASSKYFAEKFVGKLREEAALGRYEFSDVGYFQMGADHQLVFKPQEKVTDDPAFYGFPQLSMYKLAQPSPGGDLRHIYGEPASAPVTLPPPVQVVEKQQYFEEDTDRKRPANIWLIILIALTLIALAVFGVYKFYPEAFDKVSDTYHKVTGKKDDAAVPVYRHEEKTDTVKTTPVPVKAKDTVVNKPAVITPAPLPPAPVADSVYKGPLFNVILKRKYTKLGDAKYEVNRLKTKGIEARILSSSEAPGPLYKISFKTCRSKKEADQAMLDLVNEGKINKDLETIP